MEARIKIFIDTNIILTGTFFSGDESLLINLSGIDFLTADVCLEEARKVTQRLFKDNIDICLEKLENTFISFIVIMESEYRDKIEQASKMIPKKINDQKVLAAALHADPDYFLSRDFDFDRKDIKKLVNLKTAKEVLLELGVV